GSCSDEGGADTGSGGGSGFTTCAGANCSGIAITALQFGQTARFPAIESGAATSWLHALHVTLIGIRVSRDSPPDLLFHQYHKGWQVTKQFVAVRSATGPIIPRRPPRIHRRNR